MTRRRATARTARSGRGTVAPRPLDVLGAGLVACLAGVLAACSPSGGGPLATGSPAPSTPTASSTPSTATDTETASPTPGAGSPTPGASGTAVPASTSPSPGIPGSPSPSSSGVQVTCTTVTVTGLGRTTVGPLRTTEIATVVSDGRNLTPGTRQQTDFVPPVLTAPGGGTVTDAGTVQQVANLLLGQKHRVLTQRPAAPDEGTDPTKRPFSSPGTYAVYNASSLVTTEAVVQCAGQQQTWTFSAEGDPATGQVNCAVEPARSNALARSVFAQSC